LGLFGVARLGRGVSKKFQVSLGIIGTYHDCDCVADLLGKGIIGGGVWRGEVASLKLLKMPRLK
jgi:hypothetical protein